MNNLGLLSKKAVVITSLAVNYEQLQLRTEQQNLRMYIFDDSVKALRYICSRKIDFLFFDFSLYAARNLALRILKNPVSSRVKLVLVKTKEDQLTYTRIESITHYFDCYQEFLNFGDKDEVYINLNYLPDQERNFFENDPGSWCYEVKTNSFLTGNFFYEIINFNDLKGNAFLNFFFSDKSLNLCKQTLIASIRKSQVNGSSFMEDIYWQGNTYRVFGTCKNCNGCIFIMGSVREVGKCKGIGPVKGPKHTFLSLISHEFFTPLNAIVGFSQLLKQLDSENKNNKEYAGYISQSADELQLKFKRLYNLNQFHTNCLKVKRNYVSIQNLFQELEFAFHTEINKDQSLTLRIHDNEEDVVIFSDHEILFDILYCLLENSVKFSPKGEIKVDATVNRNVVVFSVTDSGNGFPDYLKSYLFDVFTQLDETTTRRSGGLGVGLHFSKCMVSFLGGEIDSSFSDNRFFIEFSIPAA
ncbi:MAG: sensor histidine kinase [Labilibaculum antarcticum]